MAGGLRMLPINEHEVMVIRRLLQTMKPSRMGWRFFFGIFSGVVFVFLLLLGDTLM